MSKALEEKMNNIWISDLKMKEFRNRKINSVFKKLDTWRLLSRILIKTYKEHFPDAYSNKERLVFTNDFKYLSDLSGEYLLLTKDLISIFTKEKMPVFIGNFPIFVQLKSLPVFWINGGIITLWNFYFPTTETEVLFEEVLKFSDKIAIFPRLEVASFNFIQTYSSKPDDTLPFSLLEKENPRVLELLKKYLIKNFWIIPEIDIKDANPSCIVFFKENTLVPAVPYRIVFKILDIVKTKTIYLLGSKIECSEIRISYITCSGKIRTDLIYFPKGLIKIQLEKEKIYNGLLFTFIDFKQEWLFPILFSFYEEDLHSYEILQELLLIYFRNRYITSKHLCSIEFKEDEFWNEMKFTLTRLWQKKLLPFSGEAFLRLDEKSILELIFSGLYPILVNSGNRIFHIPPPMGLLNLKEEQLKKLVEWYDTENWDASVHAFTKVGDIIKSFPAYQKLIKDIRHQSLFIRYLKEVTAKMRDINDEGEFDKLLS